MGVKTILQGEIPELRAVSTEVTGFGEELSRTLDDLADTMRHFGMLGLAAPQIGIWHRAFVVDIGSGMMEFVNPVITRQEGIQAHYESCLSLRDVPLQIERPESVTLQAMDRRGRPLVLEATGLLARLVCHEIDHLDGVLFTDRLSDEALFEQLLSYSGEAGDDARIVSVQPGGEEDAHAGPALDLPLQDAQMALDLVADVAWKLTLAAELLKDSQNLLENDVDYALFETLADELDGVYQQLQEKLDSHDQTQGHA